MNRPVFECRPEGRSVKSAGRATVPRREIVNRFYCTAPLIARQLALPTAVNVDPLVNC